MKANRLLCSLFFLLWGAVFPLPAQQSDADRKLLADIRAKAKKGDAQSQYELGTAFDKGSLGVTKNEAQAVKWFREAAEENLSTAQLKLGACYYDGHGVARDYVEAVNWFRKAAEQNHAQAQYNLGFCYATGQGVAKDYVEAVMWFRKAAEGGEVKAFNALAWMLATSENLAIRDGSNAVVFAEKAVAATNRKTPEDLDTLAAAYAEVGQFEKAVSTEQEAIALQQTEAEKNDYRTRLKLFEAKVPYRAKD